VEEHEKEKVSVDRYIEIFCAEKASVIRRHGAGLAWGVMMRLLTVGNNKAKAPRFVIPPNADNNRRTVGKWVAQ